MPLPPPPMTQLAVPLQPPPIFHQPPMVAFNGHMTETPPLPHMNIPVACLGMEGQPPPLPPHMMNGAMVPFNGENGMMGRPDNMTNPVVYVPYMETIMPTEVNVDYPPSEDSRGLDLPLNAPGQPRNIKAKVLSPKKIKVSWLPPTDSANISYNVYFNDSSVIEHPNNNCVLEDLTPDTVYHIQVSATSNGGEGEKSPMIDVKTPPFVPIIELKGHTFIVDEGKSVAIECNINYEKMCCQPFWERINENDETNKLTIREDKKDKYFGLKRDSPCLTILNAEMSDGGYYCCCIEYSTSNGEETVRSKKAHLIVEEGLTKTVYCSKEKMVGSACTSSHSSRCINKSEWSGDYLGDVIPLSGITVKIESDDKDGNGILTNEVAVHYQELEGKCDVDVPDQELEGKDNIYVPDQELRVKCDREIPAQELEGKCEVALHDQELKGKCDSAVPHQELEGKGDIAVPDQELEGACDISVPDQEAEIIEKLIDVMTEVSRAFNDFLDVRYINRDQMLIERRINEIRSLQIERFDLNINDATIMCVVFSSAQNSLTFGNLWENVDKGNVQQLRFLPFQKMEWYQNSVLMEENVQQLHKQHCFQKIESNQNSDLLSYEEIAHFLQIHKGNHFQMQKKFRFHTGKCFQILESNRNSVLDEETVQQLRLPIEKSFQRKESKQNSVLDSEFSCCFEPMVNVKWHGNNEEYYNFDQEEKKNQENIKRTDHEEFIGKSTEHIKSNNCSMLSTRILMILMMLPAFVMSESATEKSHEQYLLHCDGRFSDQIVKMINGKTELIIDNRVIKDDNIVMTHDNRVIKNDNRVIQCDNRVIKDDNRVILGDNRVIQGDNIVFQDDNRVIKDDNNVIHSDNRVIKDDNIIIKDDNRVIQGDNDNIVINDDNRAIQDDNGVIQCKNKVINDDNIVVQDDSIVTKDDNIVIQDDNIVIQGDNDNIVIKDDNDNIVIKDDNRVIQCDNKVIKDDKIVFQDDNRVIKDDNIVIQCDNRVIKDDNIGTKDDNIVIQDDNRVIQGGNDNIGIKDDNRVIRDDNGVIQGDNDNIVIKDDNIVVQDENRVTKDDNIVIQGDNDNIVTKDDKRVIKDDNIVIQCDSRVIKDDNIGTKDDNRVIQGDNDNSSLETGDISDEHGPLHVYTDNEEWMNQFPLSLLSTIKMKINMHWRKLYPSKMVLTNRILQQCCSEDSDIYIPIITRTYKYAELNWTRPEFEEDKNESLHTEERSEQRDTNSESCTMKSSVYVELAPVLKPHCFINLSELKALSQNVILQKKAAKQKKTSKDSLSHEQTSTMFKVMIVCVLVVVAYLIIMEPLSLVLSSTFKTSVPAALGLVVLSSYQMYYVVSIVIARMEIVRKNHIDDGTHILTDYERLYIIAYFCGSLVPGLWIYNEYIKILDPVELLIMCTTFCLSMMVVAWTTYLLHHIVLECLIEILLIANNVLVDTVAVFTRFVSVFGVFIVSLFEFIFRRLSEIICVILMIFVTILEHATKIAMLITLVVCRILEQLPGHSGIKILQNDLKTKCLMFKMLLNGKIVLRMPKNSDVMQDSIIGHATAQCCCDRIRSCEKNVDESCNNTGPSDQCKDPMSNCTEVIYKCSCNPGYYDNCGTCTIKINVDESCNNTRPPDQCKDPMSNCTEVVLGDYREDSNMKDMFCEIETEKVKHLQETTEGHEFIELVSDVDHGKKLIDHSLNFDGEVGDIMERSESEIDEINYERSTTNNVYSNKTIILTDLLHSTPVERDHEVCVAMEMSETEIDETNYERSATDDMFSNETIILKDLSHSTPVERDHKVCDTMEKSEDEIDKISYERAYEMSTTDDMYSNETIILKDLSHSTPAERNHLSTKKSIHEETNEKRLVCNNTTCSLDEDNLMRVELEDSENLSIDEFNITQVDNLNDYALQGRHGHLCSEDNDIADQDVFDYIRSIEIEEDGEPFCRNTKLEDDDEPFCRNTKSTSINRYQSNRVWSLPDFHIIPELNKDYQVIPELNKGDISNTSMKSDSEFASNSLKNGSDNGSLLSSCSCNVDAHVFNCQVDSLHSFVNDSNNAMQSSRTVIDLQKRQESKSHARIVESKKKPLLKEIINENVPTTENVYTIVKNTIETIKQKSVSSLTKKSCKKCFSSYRKKPRRRLTRKRLRRLIYPHRNISHVHVDIEARPLLNASERNATKNGPGSGLNNVGAADLATSQKSLTTSLPSSSNSLNNYFSKLLSGYEFSTDEKMQFEMLRVHSFQDLPASCNVSPLRLARTGFFSSGSGDEVTCFSCGVKYKGWQKNDNPNDVHRRISSDCRMVNGRETRNIPVSQQHNGIIEHSGQQESFAHTTNGFAQSTLHFDGDASTQTTEATQNREMTSEEVMKSNFPDNIQQSTNIKPPVDQPYSRQPALDRTNTDQQYARQPATDRASSVLDQNRPAQSAEDLGINLDKPKYPAYAQLNVRVSTFQGWPGYLDQTPRDMALAGFFYAGYNDYCRCFFCGGGLRNWDSGDDPWVEHTRWFPKCVFVQQNRGRRFVEIIVKRQAEMQASGNSVGNTKNQRAIKTQIGTVERSETSSQTSSQSADSNSTIDPAKASVRELGYADEIIDRAITIIKQNNPSKQKIEATDIMEVIFTITEDSETNTAVASENTPSSELNLPSTSQAVPQSNVSSQSNQPMSHSSQTNKPLVSKPNQPTAVASQSTNASENSLPSLSVSSLEHGNAAAVKSTSKEISENEIRSLQEENIQLKEQVMCKICMDKNVSIAFLPCGHLACCIDCAPAMRKCPMCRVYIKGTVKTFLA